MLLATIVLLLVVCMSGMEKRRLSQGDENERPIKRPKNDIYDKKLATEHIPDDIWLAIMMGSTSLTLFNLSLVSKKMHSISHKDLSLHIYMFDKGHQVQALSEGTYELKEKHKKLLEFAFEYYHFEDFDYAAEMAKFLFRCSTMEMTLFCLNGMFMLEDHNIAGNFLALMREKVPELPETIADAESVWDERIIEKLPYSQFIYPFMRLAPSMALSKYYIETSLRCSWIQLYSDFLSGDMEPSINYSGPRLH